MENYYRIYAKFDFQPKFKALDLKNGTQVENLFYASFMNYEELQIFINNHKNDIGYKLEAREVKTNKTIKINY